MTAINLKRRVTVPFPANVTGAAGVSVNKANGLYTVKLDSTQLAQTTLITDGANQGLFLQNRQTGVTNFLGYTDFVTNVSGNLTVPNGSVTYAKLQNVAASRLLGNATGVSAVAAEIPLASTLAFAAGSLSTAALTGDVAATAGSFVTTIQPNVVTYGKIQTVAASRIVGNPTGSVANASEISLGATLAFSGTALQTGALTGDVTAAANSFATTIAGGAVSLAKMANLAGLSVIANAGTLAATPAAATGTTDQVLRVNSAGTALGFGALNLAGASAVTGTLPATLGGTGNATYAVGDILQASTTSALSRLASAATGNALISGGSGVVSTWGKVGLTTHISGTLAEGNGGTNQTTYTLGDLLYSSAANTLSKLGGNITSSKQYLSQTGTGAVSAAPAWAAIAGADVTGAAATQVNDTNVTLTLGGTPATALLRATSFTMGWTGTLAVSRGGTGGGAASGTLLDNITGFASTGFINRTGAGTYSFSSASGVLDGIGSTRGSVLYRGAAGWSALIPGTSGQVLQSGGVGADPSWTTVTGTGTVTNVATGNGLAGGPVTTTGTITVEQITPGGRLTLQSGVPVMTTSQTGQTSIFYAPYKGRFIPVYDGTSMKLVNFTSSATDTVGLTLSTANNANWPAATNYDVFVAIVAGATQFGTVAWTNNTTRATALALFNGLQTNSASMTMRTGTATTVTVPANQGTYVGTVCSDAAQAGAFSFTYGSAAAGGGAARFAVWNQYNRVNIGTNVTDSTAGYTYTLGTVRQANGSAGNQVAVVVGQAEDSMSCAVRGRATLAAAVGAVAKFGIGLDSTTTFVGGPGFVYNPTSSTMIGAFGVSANVTPGIGLHTISANEASDGTNTATFDADSIDTLSTQFMM